MLLLLAACASHRMDAIEASNAALRQEVNALRADVAVLETGIDTLQDEVDALRASAPPPEPSQEQEREAGQLMSQAQDLLKASRHAEALPILRTLTEKYGNTRAGRAAVRMVPEVAIVGTQAPPLEVEAWFQGSAPGADAKVVMFVFWEVWCPHCKREIPALQADYVALKGKGLEIVALTRITKSATEEGVAEFLKENKVTYPVARERESRMTEAYAVTGIPAAALVKDGVVVWRGHPARLGRADLEAFLGG